MAYMAERKDGRKKKIRKKKKRKKESKKERKNVREKDKIENWIGLDWMGTKAGLRGDCLAQSKKCPKTNSGNNFHQKSIFTKIKANSK